MKTKNVSWLSLLIIGLAMMFSGCSSEMPEQAVRLPDTQRSSTHVDMGTALDRVEKMLAKVEGGKTRSRKVASIRYLNAGRNTRGAEIDSLYYLINYEDNGGFAVAGADTRLDEVYAISATGHLEESDVVENPSLEYFFDMLPDEEYINQAMELGFLPNMPERPDTTLHPWTPDIQFTDTDLSTKMGPYITSNVTKWGQGYPFNTKCPTQNGQNCLVGCAPLAAGIIMTHYEWPSSYNGVTYSWNQIKNASTSQQIVSAKIPDLLASIGANMSATYGLSETGALPKNVTTAFKRLGYKDPGSFKKFDNSSVRDKIDQNKGPIFMIGYRNSNGGGHAWVIDGYYNDYHIGSAYIGGSGGNGLMFHVIWGWNVNCNGFFKFGGTIIPYAYYNKSYDDPNWKDSYLYDNMKNMVQYTYNLQYLGNFIPNK